VSHAVSLTMRRIGLPPCVTMARVGTITLQGELVARGPAAAFILDDEQVDTVGEGAKRFPVVATVNGYTWRTSVARMRGEFMVGLNREVREGAGVQAGDTVTLELALDREPRTVEVPPALAEALDADPEAKAAFEGMAFTHRKEYARWIDEAKKAETRARRVTQAVEMIRTGRTRS
jgi:bacteriocin resistance YdeI/OmpD-like protein/uncharacterized protein DUF1905